MSILYLSIPARIFPSSEESVLSLVCRYALVSDNGTILSEGDASLKELSPSVLLSKRVMLLLAPSDVTLFQIKAPLLSAAKIKAALPAMVEERILSEPGDCIFVAGKQADGVCSVAVMDRAWLVLLSKTLNGLGARHISALPFQICLPMEPGTTASVTKANNTGIELCVRPSHQEGFGIHVMPNSAASAAQDVIDALRMIVPEAPVTLYVPADEMHAYQKASDERTSVLEDNWLRWSTSITSMTPDMMEGMKSLNISLFDIKAWRWPLMLATAVLLLNFSVLQIDWWRMRREADGLRAMMLQTFKSAWPKETVIVDPMAQMQQKIAAAKQKVGQLADDDFIVLAGVLNESLVELAKTRKSSSNAYRITSLAYREHSLFVKWKPDAHIPMDELRHVLMARNLTMSEIEANVSQIKSVQ